MHISNIQLSGRVYAGNNMCIFSPPEIINKICRMSGQMMILEAYLQHDVIQIGNMMWCKRMKRI